MNKLLLSLLFTGFATAQAAELPKFECHGTEPFWSFDLSSEKNIFEYVGEGTREFEVTAPESAHGMSDSYLYVYRLNGKKGASNENEKATVVILKDDEGNCSDGMSDTDYPYSAVLIFDYGTNYGCCK